MLAVSRCYDPAVTKVSLTFVAFLTGLSLVIGGIASSPVGATPNNADNARDATWPKLPVVYVSGSTEDRSSAEKFAKVLRHNGFDTYIFMVWEKNDPKTNPYTTVSGNSRRLPAFVDKVLSRTGAPRVDIVTWSQGGLVTRYWLKYFGGAPHVRSMVGMSALIKGSPFQRVVQELGGCPSRVACDEMSDSGKRLRALNTPTQALPGIKYFNITTRWDENAFPYTTNLMTGRGDYENLVTQKQCPVDPVFHTTMTHTPSVQSAVISALHGGPMRMKCMF
ncbi:MAG: lipase [Gordonia sp.]|jgi:triacylglycerol esterase/lipase EstA (alpha/beta hydrolase family)|nr:lipase [Gordonia sp. (in: high G+C Gram-positive bacteria)]